MGFGTKAIGPQKESISATLCTNSPEIVLQNSAVKLVLSVLEYVQCNWVLTLLLGGGGVVNI